MEPLIFHSIFNFISLLIGFLVFNLNWTINEKNGIDSQLKKSLSMNFIMQFILVLFSLFHLCYLIFCREKEFNNFAKTLIEFFTKKLYRLHPVFELLIFLNFENKYYVFKEYILCSCSKIIYLVIKSFLSSLNERKSLVRIGFVNYAFFATLILNLCLIYDFPQNTDFVLCFISIIFSLIFSLKFYAFFIKLLNKKHNAIYKEALNEIGESLIIIEEEQNSKNQVIFKNLFNSKKIFSMLSFQKKKGFRIGQESLNQEIRGFVMDEKMTNIKSTNMKTMKTFYNFNDMMNYFKLNPKKDRVKFLKIDEDSNEKSLHEDLRLTIVKKQDQKRKFFFLKFQILTKKKENKEFKIRLLTSISHELKTPMNGSLALLQILGNIVENEQNELIKSTVKNSLASLKLLENALNNIIDQSLFLSEEFILCLSNVNIRELLDEISYLTSSQIKLKSLNLRIDLDETENYSVYSDNTRLKQLILNILLNSIQFTNSGSIEIVVKKTSKRPVTFEFCIKDTGIGMDPYFCDQIVNKINDENNDFYANSTGSCMTLTVSNKIAILLGNQKLEISSTPTQGTTVKFLVIDSRNYEVNIADNVFSKSNSKSLSCIINSSKKFENMRKKNLLKSYGDPENEIISSNKIIGFFIKNHDFDRLKRKTFWCDSPDNWSKSLSSSPTKDLEEKKEKIFLSDFTVQISKEINLKPICRSYEDKTENFHDYFGVKNTKIFSIKEESPTHKNECTCNEILIVDDDAFNLLSLEMILKSLNYKCVKALNGADALEKVKEKKNIVGFDCSKFKMIFMDYQMPVMDGVEATKEILKITNFPPPIIGCTAFTTKDHVMNCFEAGMKDVIFKPITKEIIMKTINQWNAEK